MINGDHITIQKDESIIGDVIIAGGGQDVVTIDGARGVVIDNLIKFMTVNGNRNYGISVDNGGNLNCCDSNISGNFENMRE